MLCRQRAPRSDPLRDGLALRRGAAPGWSAESRHLPHTCDVRAQIRDGWVAPRARIILGGSGRPPLAVQLVSRKGHNMAVTIDESQWVRPNVIPVRPDDRAVAVLAGHPCVEAKTGSLAMR